MDKIPTVKGFTEPNGKEGVTLTFWCPYCCQFHIHGIPAGSKPREKQHRQAHCTNPDSPFLITGYYIKAFTKKEMAQFLKYYKS